MNSYEAESVEIDLAAADAEQSKLKTYLLTPRQFHRLRLAEAILDDVLAVEIVLPPVEQLRNGDYIAGWNAGLEAMRAFQKKLAEGKRSKLDLDKVYLQQENARLRRELAAKL